MKKLLLVISGLALVFSGCFIDDGDWDGELTGAQYYVISVSQDGPVVRATVTVDSAKLTEYKENLGTDETFQAPEELFFWLSPTFWDGHNSGSMYPAARKMIRTGDLFDANGEVVSGGEVIVDIDIEALARDWNIWWIDTWKFDEPGNEFSDDMNGFYLFMSDDYRRYDNSGCPATRVNPG